MLRTHWRNIALLIGIFACVLGFVSLIVLGPLVTAGVFGKISIQFIKWSPNGEHLALTETQLDDSNIQYQLYVASRDGNDLWRASITDTSIVDYEWSPDGTQIAFVGSVRDGITRRDIFIAAVAVEPRQVRELVADIGRSPALDWSPDSASVVYWNTDKMGLVLVDVEDGSAETIFSHPDITYLEDIAWSPEGDRIALLSSGTIYVIDLDGELVSEYFDEDNRPSVPVVWSGDGDAIQFPSSSGILEVDVGGSIARLVGEYPNVLRGRFSPDGDLRAKAGCEVFITLDIAPCEELELLVINTDDDSLHYKLTKDDFHRSDWLAKNSLWLARLAIAFLFGGPVLAMPWFWHRGGCFRQGIIGLLVGGAVVVVVFVLLVLLG